MIELKNLDCLLPNTVQILRTLIQNDYLSNFVLVGGSALALHICHRKSNDLDFFTYIDSYDLKKIKKVLENFKKKEIVNITDEQIDILIEGVKVTFFNAKWDFLEPKNIKNFNLATIEQIAIMKVNTLFLRASYRDYYDLYFLAKKLGIEKIYELSRDILDGINFKLFAAALLYIDDIKDENIEHLEPIERLTLEEIRNFFEMRLRLI